MITFASTRSRVAAAVAAAAVVALAGAAPAVAATQGGRAQAPHAEGAALIAGDGTLYQSTGIASVTHPQTGVYCVSFTEPRLTVDNLIAEVTPAAPADWGTDAYPASGAIAWCPSSALAVLTALNGQYKDEPFYLYVP